MRRKLGLLVMLVAVTPIILIGYADQFPDVDGFHGYTHKGYSDESQHLRVPFLQRSGPTVGDHIWPYARTDGLAPSSPSCYGWAQPEAEEDMDLDDDGVSNFVESVDPRLDPHNWDTDGDGLSDGLETGVKSPVIVGGVCHTRHNVEVYGIPGWTTWQPWEGTMGLGGPLTTKPDDPDTDGDGIVDGLEDVNRNGRWGEDDSDTSFLGVPELSPEDPDTDNDELLDGVELRIWGASFATIVQSPGWDFQQLVYSGSPASEFYNPFETDPRNGDTDGDGVPDGDDVNPRANAFLEIVFERETADGTRTADFFKALGPSDPWGSWKAEVEIAVETAFLNLDSYVSTDTRVTSGSEDWERLPPEPWEPFALPEGGLVTSLGYRGPENIVDPVTGAPGLRFDVPDTRGDHDYEADLVDRWLEFQVGVTVVDLDLFRGSDVLDLNPDPSEWSAKELFRVDGRDGDGIADARGEEAYLSPKVYHVWEGDGKGPGGRELVPAAIGFRTMHNIPYYFAMNAATLRTVGPDQLDAEGSCHGTVDCR